MQDAYAMAFEEWEAAGESRLWDGTIDDGIADVTPPTGPPPVPGAVADPRPVRLRWPGLQVCGPLGSMLGWVGRRRSPVEQPPHLE
jgi:hypothetical protein